MSKARSVASLRSPLLSSRGVVIVLLSVQAPAQTPAKTPATTPAARLVERLGSEDARTRHDAYRQLRDKRPSGALPLLEKALPGYSIHAQSLGISLLLAYPPESVEALLRRFLTGKSPFLALASAVRLYQRGDRGVVSHMVRALRADASGYERSLMLSRLHNVRSPELTDAVVRLLVPEALRSVLDPALQYLLRAKATEAVTPVAKLLREDDRLDAEQRGVCAAFLLAMGESQDAGALAAAIPDLRNFSRIDSMLRRVQDIDKLVLAAVLEYVERNRGGQAAAALRFLARHDYTPAVRKMRELIGDDDITLSKAAFDALMTMGQGLEPKVLRRLLNSQKVQVVITAADALRRLDDTTGLTHLVAIFRKGGRYKADAVGAIGKFRVRAAIPLLLDALEDSDTRVRMHGQNGLTTVLRGLHPYKRFDLAATGYRHTAPLAVRQAAVVKIRQWWARQSDGK